MNEAIYGGAIATAISMIGQLVWYFGIQRREEKRDDIIRTLETEVKTLRDKELVQLDQRLTADHEAHGDLHNKINLHVKETEASFGKLPERFVSHQMLDVRLEMVTRAEKQIERIWGRIEEVTRDLAATSTLITMIAGRLSISLPGSAPQRSSHEQG